MFTFALAFAIFQSPADAALDRYAALMKNLKSYSVDLAVKVDGAPEMGKGRFLIDSPTSYRFEMAWGKDYDYQIMLSPKGEFEKEKYEKVYDIHGYDGLQFPESRISPVPQIGFPSILNLSDLRSWMTEGVVYKGKEAVGGVSADVVQARVVEKGNPAIPPGFEPVHYLTVSIDQAGQLKKFISEVKVKEKTTRKVTQFFTNFVSNPTVKPTEFDFKLPTGYVPYTVHPEQSSLKIGEALPMGDWQEDGLKVSLSSKIGDAPALVVVTGDDPSMEPNVDGFLADMKSSLNVIHLTTSVTPVKGALYGGQMDVRGTPSFFLVNAKGVVQNLWYGFAAQNAAAFKADILAAKASL